MPISSGWPLETGGIRFFVPLFATSQLKQHPLTVSLYVQGMGYYPKAVGHHMQRSEHEDYLVMYFTEGRGTLTVGSETSKIKRGDLIVLPKNIPHEYRADSQEPWSLYWVHFEGTAAGLFLDNLNMPLRHHVIPLGLHPKLINDFDNLLSVRKTGYNLNAFIYASNLLAQMLSYIAMLTPKTKMQPGNYIDLDEIQAMMEEHINGQLDLETIAKEANLSKYHFSKKYKDLTGYSPIQHFIHLKMERACYLLDISNQSVAAVSETLGYEDAQYFSRIFKKVIGLSPREYRKLERG